MHATAELVRPEFKGSATNKELVGRVFDVIVATARFYSPSSTIPVSLDSLAEFFANADGGSAEDLAAKLDAALQENEHVFTREEREDGVYFLTTRSGIAPTPEPSQDLNHTFAKRFMDPPPIPEGLEERRRKRGSMVQPSEAEEVSDDVTPTEAEPETETADEIVPEPAPAAQAQEGVETISDLTEATDEEIAEALSYQLTYDYSVANFGDHWMAEDKVPRLSRGDLRRIKDYIGEQGGPVSDRQIVQDLFGIRQSSNEYELQVFAVNFRLSRETRDFEFVGIPGAHFWSTSDMPTPSIAHRKASEVGQDYRVLLDLPDVDVPGEPGVVEHVLTFYEHRHGVLPYDSAFRSIIAGPVLPGQRSAIVQFESPLTNQSFNVEVRFPTGNRGGFLAGFADFFQEHLVPGAFVTIEAADQPGKYTIEFLTVSGQDRKLLMLDEKKNEYKFESTTFFSAPNEDMLVSENRFPKLAGTSPLDDRTRRQPEQVLANAFNFVGEKLDESDGQLMAVMDELLAAANIDRPMPAELIRALATSGDHPEFTLDPEADDVIYFRPGTDTESAG